MAVEASEEHTTSVLEQLLTPQELVWLVVGVHEAGHMIAALDGDLEVDYAEIHRGWFGVEGSVWYKDQDFDMNEKRLARCVSCYSGRVAHERFLIEYGIRSSQASREAESASEWDMQNFLFLTEGYDFTRDHVRSLSEQLIDRRWHSIVLLGTILCEKKRMSAAQAERVAG